MDLPKLRMISHGEFDADYKHDDLSDLGVVESKPSISLEKTEFSLKQSAKRIGKPNFSAFNNWKKVWVAEFLEKRYWSNMPGKTRVKQQLS
jgi:hypothetical protein